MYDAVSEPQSATNATSLVPRCIDGAVSIDRIRERSAATIEWLCVDAPGALTGAVIDVDGGFRP